MKIIDLSAGNRAVWNDHTRKLSSVLALISQWWEPQQRGRSRTFRVMLRRRDCQPFVLAAE